MENRKITAWLPLIISGTAPNHRRFEGSAASREKRNHTTGISLVAEKEKVDTQQEIFRKREETTVLLLPRLSGIRGDFSFSRRAFKSQCIYSSAFCCPSQLSAARTWAGVCRQWK